MVTQAEDQLSTLRLSADCLTVTVTLTYSALFGLIQPEEYEKGKMIDEKGKCNI